MSLPGDHNSIFWEPHVEALAQALTHALEKRPS
jgi:thioesterase domain-containing protein